MKRRAKKKNIVLRAYAIPLFFLMSVMAPATLAPLMPTEVVVSVVNPRPAVVEHVENAPEPTILPEVPIIVPISPRNEPSDIITVRLQIPAIGVDADVEDMGLTAEGAMAVPDNNTQVGWYGLGTRPGDIGSAVIGGHNEWNAAVAVFDRLNELRKGDTILFIHADGTENHFVVREMRTFTADADATDVFESTNGARLNLITCSGMRDATTGDYADRLIVFADLQ